MQWYQVFLVAACVFAWMQKSREITRAAWVLLLNASVLSAWFAISGNNDNVALAMLVDVLSAWVIMTHPAGKEQGWLGMTYAFQIGCHASALSLGIRGIGIPMIQPSYWMLLHYAFILQVCILVIWSEGHGGKLAAVVDRFGRYIRDRAQGAQAGAS